MPDFAVMVTLLSVMGADGRLCSRESLWTEEQREQAATCDMPSIIFKDDNVKKVKISPRHGDIVYMPGALNVAGTHEVTPGRKPLPLNFYRQVSIYWLYALTKEQKAMLGADTL